MINGIATGTPATTNQIKTDMVTSAALTTVSTAPCAICPGCQLASPNSFSVGVDVNVGVGVIVNVGVAVRGSGFCVSVKLINE